MKLHLECYPCLLNQALKTSKLIGLNENDTEAVVNHTMRLLLADHKDRTAPHITAGIYQFIRGEFYKQDEVFDPYREIKRDTNNRALEYYERLAGMVDSSSSPL
ncbi:MAG: protein-glutamate O-methyltransferase family protein, partial [bacterium]|nr:protein-glutamate O-methyltransferase family protein [bacterium]